MQESGLGRKAFAPLSAKSAGLADLRALARSVCALIAYEIVGKP
jgi:hypothetical protein